MPKFQIQDITLGLVLETYKATGLRPASYGHNTSTGYGCPLEAIAIQEKCQWYEVLGINESAAFGTGFDRAWMGLESSHYYEKAGHENLQRAYNRGKAIANALKSTDFCIRLCIRRRAYAPVIN